MALRLTDAAPASQPSSAPTTADSAAIPPAVLLGARAESCLAARDVAGFRALFGEAAQVTDEHRRYQARKRLLEAGLSTGGTQLKAMGPVFAAVAREALELLDQHATEPVFLTYAGVAFYELGELDAAEALFSAARRLDPELPHLDGNLTEIERRRRAGLSRLELPGALAVVLKQLAPRAKKVAAKARPQTGLTLSLCMIVKDEEAMLGRCLEAIRDHVDEIIVVDTGSTDRTVEIAEANGAKVLHHEWTGDFAVARNVSFDAATGDWLLYLDADEVLVEGDGERLRALTRRTWREAMYLVETNHTGELGDGAAVTHNALRLFKNRPEYRFEGRIHEQIAHRLPGYLAERIEISDVRIEHFGYLGVVRDTKDKSRRNIELLRKQEADGDQTPFLNFNIGSELAAVGDVEASLAEFRIAWDKIREEGAFHRLGYAPSLGNRLVKALRCAERLDEARSMAAEVLELYPGYTDIVLEQALIARANDDLERAERLLHECLEMGEAPSGYTSERGTGTYLAQIHLADLLRAQGRHDEAQEIIKRTLAEHPDFIGVVEPYAAIRLAGQADPSDVVAELHAAIDSPTPGARFMLAVALHEAGAAEQAEAELRAVVAAQPASAPARLALVETLLSQTRFDEVAEVLAPIPADSPWAASAARSAAFAALAAGDADAARDVLATPQVDQLPAAELAALRAWQAVAAGDEPAGSLPADAGVAVIVMLEALARVEAFDAFEQLAARYETVEVPWRERREQLAQLYLRRGFLESAADEWVAVCQEHGSDAAALVGLAQVAWSRGMDDEVAVFAEEALELEPGNAGAARLLEFARTAA